MIWVITVVGWMVLLVIIIIIMMMMMMMMVVVVCGVRTDQGPASASAIPASSACSSSRPRVRGGFGQ